MIHSPAIFLNQPQQRRFRLSSAKPSTSYNEGCGKPIIPNHLIRSGVETERGEWPWLAALYTINTLGGIDFWCSGTLINNKHIVTVALANPNVDEINLAQGAQQNFRKSEDLVVYSGLDPGQDTARGSPLSLSSASLKPILWDGGWEGERRGVASHPTKVTFRANKNRWIMEIVDAAHCIRYRDRVELTIETLVVYLGRFNLKKFSEQDSQQVEVTTR
uniref:Peptidase S1 domain-containing protein n=1 Tax=Timema genevievae TaxID=629358 RepID=A0A7R9K8X9_TIMGE|nr:unnamed protein product [Timema genevievae]